MQLTKKKLILMMLIILLMTTSISYNQFKQHKVYAENEVEEAELYEKKIDLTDSYELEIKETKDNVIELNLKSGGRLTKSIAIGNAGIRDDLIKHLDLNNNGEKEYFITAYDIGSTFGARTNIVVWKEGIHWNMNDAPFKRGFVEDKRDDGKYEIVEYYDEEKSYYFEDGLFVEIE